MALRNPGFGTENTKLKVMFPSKGKCALPGREVSSPIASRRKQVGLRSEH